MGYPLTCPINAATLLHLWEQWQSHTWQHNFLQLSSTTLIRVCPLVHRTIYYTLFIKWTLHILLFPEIILGYDSFSAKYYHKVWVKRLVLRWATELSLAGGERCFEKYIWNQQFITFRIPMFSWKWMLMYNVLKYIGLVYTFFSQSKSTKGWNLKLLYSAHYRWDITNRRRHLTQLVCCRWMIWEHKSEKLKHHVEIRQRVPEKS